jgi:hypothetical protein
LFVRGRDQKRERERERGRIGAKQSSHCNLETSGERESERELT